MTVLGSTLPVVIREFGWSYRMAGLMLSGNAAAYFVSTLASGAVLHRFGLTFTLGIGLIGQGVGVLLFGYLPSALINFAWLVLIGLGQGMIEVSANCAALQMARRDGGRGMNLLHAAFTIGAVSMPVLSTITLGSELPWRLVFLISGLLTLVLAGLALKLETREGSSGQSSPRRWGGLRDPRLIVCFAVILLYVGIEMGVSQWIGEFFFSSGLGGAALASGMISIYWLGILLGRFGMGYACRKQQVKSYLVVYASIALLGLSGFLVVATPVGFAITAFLTGVGLSVIYPMTMLLVGQQQEIDQGFRVGVVASGGGVGALLFPLLMGGIADRVGLRATFMFLVATCVLLTLVCLGNWVASRAAVR